MFVFVFSLFRWMVVPAGLLNGPLQKYWVSEYRLFDGEMFIFCWGWVMLTNKFIYCESSTIDAIMPRYFPLLHLTLSAFTLQLPSTIANRFIILFCRPYYTWAQGIHSMPLIATKSMFFTWYFRLLVLCTLLLSWNTLKCWQRELRTIVSCYP